MRDDTLEGAGVRSGFIRWEHLAARAYTITSVIALAEWGSAILGRKSMASFDDVEHSNEKSGTEPIVLRLRAMAAALLSSGWHYRQEDPICHLQPVLRPLRPGCQYRIGRVLLFRRTDIDWNSLWSRITQPLAWPDHDWRPCHDG